MCKVCSLLTRARVFFVAKGSAKILTVLDLIPPGIVLPDLQKRIARLASGERGVVELEGYVRIHEWLIEAMKQTPDDFQQLVWEGGKEGLSSDVKRSVRKFFVKGDPQTTRNRILQELLKGDDVLDDIYIGHIDDAVREYSFIRDTENKLRKIIDMAGLAGSWLGFLFPLEASGTITVNENGIVEISHDRFAAAVDGVDATLIRECDNCANILGWTKRQVFMLARMCSCVAESTL